MRTGLRPLPPPSPHPSSAGGAEAQRTQDTFRPVASRVSAPQTFFQSPLPQGSHSSFLGEPRASLLPSPVPTAAGTAPVGGNRTPSAAPRPHSLSLGQRGITLRPALSFSRRGGAWGTQPLLPGCVVRSGAPGAQPPAAPQPRLPPVLLQHPSLPAGMQHPAS